VAGPRPKRSSMALRVGVEEGREGAVEGSLTLNHQVQYTDGDHDIKAGPASAERVRDRETLRLSPTIFCTDVFLGPVASPQHRSFRVDASSCRTTTS
jgi:hypothetical protein